MVLHDHRGVICIHSGQCIGGGQHHSAEEAVDDHHEQEGRQGAPLSDAGRQVELFAFIAFQRGTAPVLVIQRFNETDGRGREAQTTKSMDQESL